MGESTFPNPHDKDIRQVEEGLGKRAVYDSTNQAWKLPTGKNAAIGEWIWVNGQIGQATAAIVGGTDAIVEGTNWTEDTDGALNALNSNLTSGLSDKIASLNSHGSGRLIADIYYDYQGGNDRIYFVRKDGTTFYCNATKVT